MILLNVSANKKNDSELLREVQVLHRAFLNSEAPKYISEKYVDAHNYYLKDIPEKDELWMKKVLQLGLDIEALEIALELMNKKHILVRKIKILIYLCESFHPYYDRFINERVQRRKAFILLTFHVFRSVYKLIKGLALLLWYRTLGENNV